MEASTADIEFKDGQFRIAGTDRSVGLMELAQRLHGGLKLPEGAPTSLDVDHVGNEPVPSPFPNGCHIAEVEGDPATAAAPALRRPWRTPAGATREAPAPKATSRSPMVQSARPGRM